MTGLADILAPPYYAVIFSSLQGDDRRGYAGTARRMMELAARQPGFLGVETAHDEIGITVSYWRDLESIEAWRRHAEHAVARRSGRERWYRAYRLRVARVERAHEFNAPQRSRAPRSPAG